MERGLKEEDSSDSREFDVVESIRVIAAFNARAPLNTEKQLLLYLQSWWSRTYNRPLKDPLLASYSLEELLYEFYDRVERTKAEEERFEQENDKIEENKEKVGLDWAEEMERKELEEEARKASQPIDPSKDPKNIAWMEDQIKQAKEQYGESFGEDVDERFDG